MIYLLKKQSSQRIDTINGTSTYSEGEYFSQKNVLEAIKK